MKKRITAVLCALLLVLTGVFTYSYAFANEIDWSFDAGTKTLYITGTGAMDDYEQAYETPWRDCILQTEHLIVEDGVTSIGAYAFAGASVLESVSLPDSVTAIGQNCFYDTPALMSLTFSQNVTAIGDPSFAMEGVSLKNGFVLNTEAGSYALYYAINNGIPFDCDSVLFRTIGRT